MHMLNIVMTRGAQQEDRREATRADWCNLVDEQARNVPAWQRLLSHYDAVIPPTWGTTAFAHDETPINERSLIINDEKTRFNLQLAFPGLATFPMLPATSVPIGREDDGLPIGVPVIANSNRDFTAIAVAREAHRLVMQ